MPVVIGFGLTLAPVAAQAAPWWTGAEDLAGTTIYFANQVDESGDYILAFSCDYVNYEYTLFVIEPEPWDQAASYAPDVEATFVVDGKPTSTSFYFASFDEKVSIVLGESNPTGLDVMGALLGSQSSIEVSYFDRNLSFSAEGAHDGLLFVEDKRGL
jgi:hypothetical protein